MILLIINFFKKNVRIQLTNLSGQTIFVTSTRAFDYQSKLRKSEDALFKVLWFFLKNMKSLNLIDGKKKHSIAVRFHGIGLKGHISKAKTFLAAVHQYFIISRISYVTPVPHNGSKVKKKRR